MASNVCRTCGQDAVDYLIGMGLKCTHCGQCYQGSIDNPTISTAYPKGYWGRIDVPIEIDADIVAELVENFSKSINNGVSMNNNLDKHEVQVASFEFLSSKLSKITAGDIQVTDEERKRLQEEYREKRKGIIESMADHNPPTYTPPVFLEAMGYKNTKMLLRISLIEAIFINEDGKTVIVHNGTHFLSKTPYDELKMALKTFLELPNVGGII